MQVGAAEIGIDQEDAPAVERQTGGEVACDGGFPVAGRVAGDQDAAGGIQG